MAQAHVVKRAFFALLTFCLLTMTITSYFSVYSPASWAIVSINSLEIQEKQDDDIHRCKAMFTVSSPFKKDWIPRSLQENPNWYLTNEVLRKASLQLHFIRDMRNRDISPSTEDYKKLGRLLPNLFYFSKPQWNLNLQNLQGDDLNLQKPSPEFSESLMVSVSNMSSLEADIMYHYNNRKDMKRKHNAAFSNELPKADILSRLQSTGGIFPFIPCRIHQHTKENVFHCFAEKIRQKENGNFTIFFLGDSKIRSIYSAFLNVTNDLRYIVSYGNNSGPWESVIREMQKNDFKHDDFDAVSSVYPKLNVVMKFRRFWDLMHLETCDEVVMLKKWASGAQPVPDLLIIGYTSWMLYLHFERIDYKTNVPLDIVNLLFNLHQVIVPLLTKVSLRTKVLVHADTRVRPHSKSDKIRDRWLKNVLFHDSLIDWSELIFWYLFRKQKHYEPYKSLLLTSSHKVLNEFLLQTQDKNNSLTKLKAPATHVWKNVDKNPSAEKVFSVPEVAGNQAHHSKNYLNDFGLWWWDTSLVLNVATISECSALYNLQFRNHSLYNGPQLKCEDHHHAGNGTNEVEVQMILNLVCNSIIGANEQFCCS